MVATATSNFLNNDMSHQFTKLGVTTSYSSLHKKMLAGVGAVQIILIKTLKPGFQIFLLVLFFFLAYCDLLIEELKRD